MNKTITNLKTREQVQADFKAAGITLSEWARANGFHRMTVVDLLRGARQGLRGETHRCAVALGLPHVQIYNFDTAWRTGPLATDPAADKAVQQISVFATPQPSPEAVWQAWESLDTPVLCR